MEENIKTWLCRKCGTEKPIAKFRNRRSKLVRALHVDTVCMTCRGKRAHAELKLEMLDALGGKCACCGESHPYLLTLEHINGRNFQQRRHRRDVGEKTTNTYVEMRRAKREGWDPTVWELLCWNCNCSKGHFGQCPHRTGITSEQVYASLRFTATHAGGKESSIARMIEGGKATRYKEGQERPEMRGNKHYPKYRDAHGHFSSEQVN